MHPSDMHPSEMNPAGHGTGTHWATVVTQLRAAGVPAVLVTILAVRGHAPRAAGAKLIVTAERTWGSVGGGNLEAEAIDQAQAMLARGAREPVQAVTRLSDKAHQAHGRQCCGGEVTLGYEPLPAPATIAIMGLGHVGLELARILARLDVRLELIDSRESQLDPLRVAELTDQLATVRLHHRVVPESLLAGLPVGAALVIMTHDHAEDFALCDAALRELGPRPDRWSRIGLIGSATKWARFRRLLVDAGHAPADVDRIECPIGDPALGKEPAAIAVAIAASLLSPARHPSRVHG